MDTPLLTDPLLLNELINEFQPPEDFLGLRLLGSMENYPFPTFEAEIEHNVRNVASLNVPNAEANLVGMLGYGSMSGKFMYARLKKNFPGTLLKWLREPGTPFARQSADQLITKEMMDLFMRIQRLKEYIFWKIMTTGAFTANIAGVEVTLNWGLPNSHKPTASVPWNQDSVGGADGYYDADIISDLTAWEQVVLDDSYVKPNTILVNSLTLDVLYKNKYLKDLWTDRMKEEILNKGYLSGVRGYNWRVYDLTYQNSAGASVAYVPEGKVLLYNDQGIIEGYNGPSPDAEAPQNTFGRFAKAWFSKDPSGWTGLQEDTFFIHLRRPKQLLVATAYTP